MKFIRKLFGIFVILIVVVTGVSLIKAGLIPNFLGDKAASLRANIGGILPGNISFDLQNLKDKASSKVSGIMQNFGISLHGGDMHMGGEIQDGGNDLWVNVKNLVQKLKVSDNGGYEEILGRGEYNPLYNGNDDYSSSEGCDMDAIINKSNDMLYWDYFKDDAELSIVMKAMGLRSTACAKIFCQSVADDGTYNNQKHYYWDVEKEKMILLPGVYFVSRNDCAYYERIYGHACKGNINDNPQKKNDNCTCNIWYDSGLPACEDCGGCSCDAEIASTKYGGKICHGCGMEAYKPIIYLYPNVETEINIKLGTPENLSHTYPKYNSEKGRNVIAQPNGDLVDIDTGKKLYALYREGESKIETNFDKGFVVAGKDIIPFLEEKLAILGLNEREAEEFIVYRLPQMENNEWNLIRFETIEEQNSSMPLNILPTPDTVIRVMMDWKAIDEWVDIPEQQLTTPERNGFTVVEWGGSPRN